METSMNGRTPGPLTRTRSTGISANALAQAIIIEGRSLAGEVSACLDRLAERVVLFRWGEFVFVTFGCLAGLGTLLSLGWLGVILTGQGVPAAVFLRLALLSSAAVVLGSWVLAQLLDWRLVLANPRRTLRRPVFVSWGGLAAMLAVLALVAGQSHISVLLVLDATARALPLGHALGRLGCLSYGCCYGLPTHGPLAIRYRNPEAKAVRVAGLWNVPLHPTAFYEAVLDLGILALVNGASVAGVPLGVPFALTLILYGCGRFVVESRRDDRDIALLPSLLPGGGPHSSFPLSRFLCAGLVLVGATLLPGLLQHPAWTRAVHWQTAIAGIPALLPAIALPTLLVFVGFGLHRRRVGEW